MWCEHDVTRSLLLSETIDYYALKVVDQERYEVYVVFTMSVYALELK